MFTKTWDLQKLSIFGENFQKFRSARKSLALEFTSRNNCVGGYKKYYFYLVKILKNETLSLDKYPLNKN